MSYDSQRLGLPDREETIKAPILADGSLNKIILCDYINYKLTFICQICTVLHPLGPLTTLSDFLNINLQTLPKYLFWATSRHSNGRFRTGMLYCRCLPGPLVRMTLSHHVKDSRLKCAAFAGGACPCYMKTPISDRRCQSEYRYEC